MLEGLDRRAGPFGGLQLAKGVQGRDADLGVGVHVHVCEGVGDFDAPARLAGVLLFGAPGDGGARVVPGTYTVRLTMGTTVLTQKLDVKQDPRLDVPARVVAEFPQFPAIEGYEALREAFRAASIRDL
mgnify:CR=1 FL=1